LPLEPERPGAKFRPVRFLKTGFNELFGEFSPDGQWVAFELDESGRNEIYVAPFAQPVEKHQVSTNGGERPRWRQDGNEIFYLALDEQLMATEVQIRKETIEVGKARAVVAAVSVLGTNYVVTGDGKRLLAAVPVYPTMFEPVTLVQNWTAALKRWR
jgi:Tol biopolymer transport system component